jgi:Tol biopolymer transport system component
MSQKSTIRDQALYIAISLLMLVAFSLSGCASLQPPTPSLSPLHSPTAPAMLSPTTLPLPSPTTSPTAQSTPTAAVAPSATPVVPLPTGLIAYVGPDNQLRLMQADGSNQQALTTGETVVSPAWSPDGQTLAYISRQGPSGQAFLYSLSSQQAQPIGPVEDSNPHTLNWSADGLYLLLDSGTSVISTATIFDVATGQVAQQLQVELYAWSPTGHRLAFGREHPLATPLPIGAGNSIDLVVLDAAQGTELVVFEGSSTELYTPQGWLPDGRLLYDRFDWDPATQSGEDTLWTVTVDDTVGVPQPAADIPPQFDPAAVLARLPADLRDSVTGFFSWSPDDRWVLFQVQEGNQTVIYRFDWKTGGQPVRLADGSSAVWQPAPSPVTPASAEPPATPAPTVVFTVPVGPDGVQYGAEQTGPMALAAAADGTFWIADTQGNRLLHYDPQGALLNRIDLNGYGTGASDVEAIGSDVTVLLVGNGEQVLRFTADGNLLATYDVPKGLGPEGGLTGLATGDHGEILLEYESGAELVQLVDAQRVLHPAPLPGYTHEGRLFKALLADRLSSHGSIMVGSRRIEVTVPNILAGMRILGFTPAGDFYVTVDEMASTPTVWVDKTVRLYDRAGKLLGMARVPLAEWYTCVQNGLAVGTDGRICALLTYPDQVKVVRLGFSAELEPILPTPIAASMPAATVSPSPAERPATATSPSWRRLSWRRLSWRRILFSYNHQGVAEVWTVDPAAGLARREIRPEQQIKDPAVSPEGETIAYICATGDYGGVPSELWLMDSDGANPRRLYVPPPGQGVLSQVAWQPDGQAIYFLQSGSGASNRLLRIPSGGGEPTAILSDCLDFALSPDE